MFLRIIILALTLIPAGMVHSQTLVGLAKDDVVALLNSEYRRFSPDKTVVKQEFNYLKYVNSAQTITLIIYFNDQDISTSSKKVCDYIEYDFILDELNDKYESTGDMLWEYTEEGKTYTLALEEKDWYFTVRERLKENGN